MSDERGRPGMCDLEASASERGRACGAARESAPLLPAPADGERRSCTAFHLRLGALVFAVVAGLFSVVSLRAWPVGHMLPLVSAVGVGGPQPELSRRDEVSSRQGPISEVFTFGSPGIVHSGSLTNGFVDGGCFPGYRVYSRTHRSDSVDANSVADPVAWITAQFSYAHPMMRVMVADQDAPSATATRTCGSESNLPPADTFWWAEGHTAYESILRAQVDLLPTAVSSTQVEAAQLRRAYLMIHLSFMIYSSAPQKLGIDASDWGFTLVGFASFRTGPAQGLPRFFAADEFDDSVALYQNDETLECVLVFEGTGREDPSDWLSDADARPTDFCGMATVHEGFKRKLMRAMLNLDYQAVIKSKLPSCRGVTVTGHSMGGAQASLFAACANRAGPADPRFAEGSVGHRGLIAFAPAAPARLAPFYAPRERQEGRFVRNAATGLCLDVKGAMATADMREVVVQPCQTMDSNHTREQRWHVAAGGAVVSELSGLCMDLEGSAEEAVAVQRQCAQPADLMASRRQTWHLTEEGFLLNSGKNLCLDSRLRLRACPFTLQRWQLLPSGALRNFRSGLCLGAIGATPGSPLSLARCPSVGERGAAWELSGGVLRERGGGLCARAERSSGGLPRRLILAACEDGAGSGVFVRLAWLQDAFLRNTGTGLCLDLDRSQHEVAEGAQAILARCEHRRVDTPGIWKFMPGGFLRNIGDDWINANSCVEVAATGSTAEERSASRLADGARLQMKVCEYSTDQRWSEDRGRLRNELGGRRCLQLKAADGGGVLLRSCSEWLGATWNLTRGRLRSEAGDRCIAAAPGGVAPIVAPCRDAPASTWRLLPGGVLVERVSSRCLGRRGPSDGDVPLTLGPCREQGDGRSWNLQRWRLERGSLRPRSESEAGACAVVDESGTGLSLAAVCPGDAQRLELTPSSHIRNPTRDLCLDVVAAEDCGMWGELTGACQVGGWKLTAATCDPSRTQQRWALIDS